jgi:hypothetical protein
MSQHDHNHPNDQDPGMAVRPRCCPCGCEADTNPGLVADGVSRRGFLGGAAALGGVALTGLSWSALAAEPELPAAPARRPLVVKPVFIYQTYTPRPQTSWRSWGGIQTKEDVEKEIPRIKGELDKLQAGADFPMKLLPIAAVHGAGELAKVPDVASADVLLVYAAGGSLDEIGKFGKHVVFFIRHRSGPVYLWYEIISPRYLRQHTDEQVIKGIEPQDVVVDNYGEVTWRLRALCGLVNTVGTKILAIGGPGAWAQPKEIVPDLVRKLFKLEIKTIDYRPNRKAPDDQSNLESLIKAARQDQAAVALAKKRAAEYLKVPGTTLETKLGFVENAFLLEQVFRKLMARENCRAITINSCMGTIMPMSETTACLPLSTLNDDGYMAFCESDFVVIPSGILLGNISGRPNFLNDPTYPHDGIITLAHCTGPRKMNGKDAEPVRILTHFESDYGAAPKVEMRIGQKVTNVIPDFKQARYVGFAGEIVAHEFLPICRCQIDVKFNFPDQVLAERMPGFHWMTFYGDYIKEMGYALRKIPIKWEVLA